MTRLGSVLRRRIGRFSLRGRAIGMFCATSLAARAVGVVCQLIQVPIAVRSLGSEAFGLWMALTSVSYVILFADFGVGQGAQNQLARALATGGGEEVGDLVGTTLLFLTAIGAALGLVVTAGAGWIDFSHLFHLSNPAVRLAARPSVELSLLLCCLNVPLGFAQRLAYARQEGWKHNLAQAAGGVGSLAGVLLAASAGWGLTGFIAAAQGPVVLSNAVLLGLLLDRTCRPAGLRLRCRGATMKGLFRLGACFGIQQIHLTLLLALPQALISTQLGAAAVTPYNLAQRLFNLFAIIQNAFMIPLWPAYSEASARGDIAWIRRALKGSVLATVGCTVIPMALGAAFAHPLLLLWIGRPSDLPSAGLGWVLFLWNAIVFIEQPFGYLLAGLSEVRKVTRYSIIGGAASAVLMSVGVRRFGAEGLVVGMGLGFLPYLFIGVAGETGRVLRTVLRLPSPSPQPAGSRP